jgi:DNA-binding IclR family transcriptional regulator
MILTYQPERQERWGGGEGAGGSLMAENGTTRRRRRQEAEVDDLGACAGDDQFVVRALCRGLRVLALFNVDHPEWSLNELARTTHLHKATTYRMTRTMEAEGFLVFDPASGNYHLGPAVIPLSYLARTQSELERMAKPFLEKLAAESGETANLAIETEGSFIVIGSVLTAHTFKPSLPIGRVLTDLSNAHGKLSVALKSPEEQAKFLSRPQPPSTKYSLTDRKQIEAELARVAEEGVAYDMEEHGLGVCSVAAPVLGPNGAMIASISAVAPKERFGPEERKRATELVKRIAAEFSEYLGYSPE